MNPVIIGNATLYCGDCLEILPSLSGIDAVVSDPPYGIGYVHGGRVTESSIGILGNKHKLKPIHGDDQHFDPSLWTGFKNVLLWGADRFKTRLPDTGIFLAWDKHIGVGANDSFVDCEFAWCNTKPKRNIFRHLWKGIVVSKQGDGLGNVKHFVREHPSMKPVALMTWCIGHFKLPVGSLILDPYMGSGSTGVAAVNLGHRFIGIEIDPDYFDIACRRIEKAQRQQSLALPPPLPTPHHEPLSLLEP
jgi:site-specific DNA-methyltransferase (adenine-specific)/modification methylase